jgi:hypothetical protein
VGLCTAYDAGVAGSHGKALDNPAFSVLITAAGGKDQVAGFCATILASAHPTRHPANSDHPSGPSTHPNGPPSTHPNGPPSTHPNGPPSTHPSGPPSVSPTRH